MRKREIAKEKTKRNSLKKNNVKNILFESFLILILFMVLAAFCGNIIFAATLNCNLSNVTNCTGSGNVSIFRFMNITNGFMNAHAALNATLSGYVPNYNYSVCCAADVNLSDNCTGIDTPILRMSNYTNAHVQFGNYSGPYSIYPYSTCLSVNLGIVLCNYERSGSCSAPKTCIGSIASSESWADNLTNAHIGPCNEYVTKICCYINTSSIITGVVLNSTFGTNYTNENLTVYFLESDTDNDPLTNITDWRVNGTSLAVLNMPFGRKIDSNVSGAIMDYSTFSNNGTLGGGNTSRMPAWTTNGKVGGAYKFDGVDDFISLGAVNLGFNSQTMISLSAWINATNLSGYILYKRLHFDPSFEYAGYSLYLNSDGSMTFHFDNPNYGAYPYWTTPAGTIALGSWYNIVVSWDRSLGQAKIYVNGVNKSLTFSGSYDNNVYLQENNYELAIGSKYTGDSSDYFNGTIDEVQIFNRSLSANQINLTYQAGLANHSVQTVHADETLRKGEVWSVMLTPNDGLTDGISVISNNLTIRGHIPNVTLISPENGNATRLRTPTFVWNLTEYDGDTTSFEFNLTEYKFSGLFNCIDRISVNTSYMNYTPATDLKCFYDNNYYYIWKVRGNDTDGQGDWSAPFILNMTAVIDISMPTDFISFGTLSLLGSDDTSDGNPAAFNLQNDGNALINVSINATDLWQSTANPNDYLKYKVRENSSESNSFDLTNSITAWSQINSIMNIPNASIAYLKYPNATDSALIDIYVKVPPTESYGNKTSTVTFMSILAE